MFICKVGESVVIRWEFSGEGIYIIEFVEDVF